MPAFNLSLFSKYRTELMGVATTLIILCHMPVFGVSMPGWLSTIIGNGGIGVDIFLFLSGFGIHDSFCNRKSIHHWYKKRYLRIIVPYIILVLPFVFQSHVFFADLLLILSGFSSIFGKSPLWFISCILVLYLITPVLHNLLTSPRRWFYCSFLCIASLIYGYFDSSIIGFMISRWPSFFIAYTLAPMIKNNQNGNVKVWVIVPLLLYSVLFILNHTINTHFSLFWTQGIPVATLCVLILDFFKNSKIDRALSFMGKISLESYISNEYVIRSFASLSWIIFGMNINQGNWLMYISGTFACILISLVVNRVAGFLLKKMV